MRTVSTFKPLVTAADERELRAAFARCRRSTTVPLHNARTRNLLKRIAARRVLLAQHTLEVLAAAAADGAPRADVEAPFHVGLAIVGRWYGDEEVTADDVRALVVAEVHAESRANPVQLAVALQTEDRWVLAEAERETAAEHSATGRLLRAIQAKLYGVARPSGPHAPLRSA